MDESSTNLKSILAREIHEELGKQIKYQIGGPLFAYRQQFNGNRPDIFMVVHEINFLGGEIQLSSEHSEYIWLDTKSSTLDSSKVFSQEEYQAYQEYLFINSKE